MAPAQSTDAWLRWALLNGDGKKWEQKDRHGLKREIYGIPPRKMLERAKAYASRLLVQMGLCDTWPRTLRDFHDALRAYMKLKSKSYSCGTNADAPTLPRIAERPDRERIVHLRPARRQALRCN